MEEHFNKVKAIINSPSNEYTTGTLKFGITIASFQRKSGKSPEYLKRSLTSILNQTAANWKIYLVGDKYENNSEFEEIIQSIFSNNMDKIQYKNLEQPGERGTLTGKALWQVAGSTAFNTGIKMALDDGCDYILHLDDDDWFDLKKIQILNYVCSAFNNPEYLFHYSTYKHFGSFPFDVVTELKLNNLLPRPAGLIHSTMCCHRSIMNNFSYNNKIHVCGDIQLIQYVLSLKHTKNINILFIPILLGFHPLQGESM